MPKWVVSMLMEENAREGFCEVIGSVHCGIDAFKVNQVTFNPVT